MSQDLHLNSELPSKKPLHALFGYFFKKYRVSIIGGAVAIVLVDVAELIMPVLLRDLIDSVSVGLESVGSGSRVELSSSGLSTWDLMSPDSVLGRTFWILLALILVQVVGRYLWRVSLARASMRGGADLREWFSNQIFHVPLSLYDKKKVGELMTLATSDAENMRMALGPGMISFIDSAFYCVTIPLCMAWLAPELTWKSLAPMMLTPMVVLFLQRQVGEASRRVQEQIGRLGTLTQEVVAGVRVIKVQGAEDRMQSRLAQESHELNRRQIRLARFQSALGPSLEFFLSVSLVLLFAGSESVSVGTLVALQRYLQKLMWPMSAIGMAIVYFQKAKASGAEFFRFLEVPAQEQVIPLEDSIKPVPPEPGQLILELENVEFSYGEKPVFSDPLSLQVRSGEWIGIEGPVGTGKSTLFSLLLGFYPPQSGQIRIAGQPIQNYPVHNLRQWFSPVLQDPYLFQGSIRSNLEFWDGMPIEAALKLSEIYEGVADRRLDESLGEKGTGLSGGQKQRLAIARALRKNAPIFLLDDPLSSVDSNTAAQVLEHLTQELKKSKKTVIFVSHRREHLAVCDRVYHWSNQRNTQA